MLLSFPIVKLGVMVHDCNPRAWETATGRLLHVGKFPTRQGCIVLAYLQSTRKEEILFFIKCTKEGL